ncbi:hypothetical protein H5410_049279 [Solanum commersonii]|uniref:Uncharacterized protein n=1 Tax=Solanum commersonii TaxID=4109 RepID=A0A9J5XLW1_SOLCO|nr:hypothetical protein H5410_049279 [Solanum commersonii]
MVDTTIARPLANYHSSVWGDYFLFYTPQLTGHYGYKVIRRVTDYRTQVRYIGLQGVEAASGKVLLRHPKSRKSMATLV